jgi:hypothetical protein
MTALVDPASAPDAGAFLARLLRLDGAALVRIKPVAEGTVALWARLPWEVLVTRAVRGSVDRDATVRAADLLAGLGKATAVAPPGHDSAWRWPLPPSGGRVVERLPTAEVRRVATAAAGTVRSAETAGIDGRAVGSRVLREALLDHVPIVVSAEGERIEVPQRLVQAVTRMGFLGTAPDAQEALVAVRVAGAWVGIAADFGTAWFLPASGGLKLRPAVGRRD